VWLTAPFARCDAACAMTGNGTQPASEACDIFELRQFFKGEEKRLLRHFFSHIARSYYLLRNGCHGAAIASDQFVERLEIAQQCGYDESVIGCVKNVAVRFRHNSLAPYQKRR
jgi:hypothetical protein